MKTADLKALITGGASGLGLAVARRVVADGGQVALLDVQEEAGRRAAAELGAGATPCVNPAFDVTPAELISGIVSERGVARAGELSQWKT